MPPLPSPSGRRYRGQCVPVNMAPHSARSQGRNSRPAASTPGDEPVRSAGAGERVQHWPGRPGLAEAQTRGPASRQRIPCRQLSARGTLASYRAAPTSAVGLGLPTAGQARRERRVPGGLGLALPTAQDAPIRTALGRPAPRRHPRRTAGVRAAPEARADHQGEMQHPNSGIPSADYGRLPGVSGPQVGACRSAGSGRDSGGTHSGGRHQATRWPGRSGG
jgi:hypothetical protein